PAAQRAGEVEDLGVAQRPVVDVAPVEVGAEAVYRAGHGVGSRVVRRRRRTSVADREIAVNGAGHTSERGWPGRARAAGRLGSEHAMTAREVAHLRRAKDLVDRCYADPLDVEALARR